MEDLVKKAITNELIRKPGAGFSDKVMDEIFSIEMPRAKVSPLVPKYFLVTAVLFVAALFAGAVLSPSNQAEVSSSYMADFFAKIELAEGWALQSLAGVNVLLLFGIAASLMVLVLLDAFLFSKSIRK